MAAISPSSRALDWRALKVLIVDHDDKFRFWARTAFRRKRVAEVFSIASDSDAVHILHQSFLDVSLVEGSAHGVRFIKQLRDTAMSPCPRLPVILLVNADDETQIRAASEAGIESVIRKPVSEAALLKRVAGTVLHPRRIVWSDSYVGPERREPPSPDYPGPRRRASDRAEGEPPRRAETTTPEERVGAAIATPAPAERRVSALAPGSMLASPDSAERARERTSAWAEEVERQAEDDDGDGAVPEAAQRLAAEADTAWQGAVKPAEPSPPEPSPPEPSPPKAPGLDIARILADHAEWVASRRQHGARAELQGADLTADDLTGATLNNANLRRANLAGVACARADFEGADLREAMLAGAGLKRANSGYAKLRHADLSLSDLEAASLRGADLAGADLRGAILVETDLAGANLLQTEFSGTDLRSAVSLTQAQLARARGDAKTRLPAGLRIAPPDE